MDSQKPSNPGNLLNDLESIRQLLEENPSPPLLTDSIDFDLIPLLSEVVNPADIAAPLFNRPAPAAIARTASTPVAFAAPAPAPAATVAVAVAAATVQPTAASANIGQQLQRSLHPVALELTQLDRELRTAAQLMLQDIIDDFVPLIEAKLQTRLDAHLTQLLNQRKPR